MKKGILIFLGVLAICLSYVVINNEKIRREQKEMEIQVSEIGLEAFNCSDLITMRKTELENEVILESVNELIVSNEGGQEYSEIFVGEKASKDDDFGLKISSEKTGNRLLIRINSFGSGNCIGEESIISILFRDGTILKIPNGRGANCDGISELQLGAKYDRSYEEKVFSTQEVEAMRIFTENGAVFELFNSVQSAQLLKTIKCLSENTPNKQIEVIETKTGESLNCSDLIIAMTSESTGDSYMKSVDGVIVPNHDGKKGVRVDVFNSELGLGLTLTTWGAGACCSVGSDVYVDFDDGTVLKLKSDVANCNATVGLKLGKLNKKELEEQVFASKLVSSLLVHTDEGHVMVLFTEQQSKQLLKTIQCSYNTI